MARRHSSQSQLDRGSENVADFVVRQRLVQPCEDGLVLRLPARVFPRQRATRYCAGGQPPRGLRETSSSWSSARRTRRVANGSTRTTASWHQARIGGEETSGAYSTATLDRLIEEAIVDAYGDSEQTSGFYTMLEDHLAVPFTVDILGTEVIVGRVDLTDDERIVAACRRGKTRQRISILDLPVPDSPPTGWEWIEAYRRFMRGR